MVGTMDRTAKDISDHALEVTGQALLTGDYASFAACFRLPYKCTTMGTSITYETDDQFRLAFNNMHQKFKLMGLTDLVRVTEAAKFTGPDRIAATHISHPMSGTIRLEEPYPVFTNFERINGVWKISSSDYALAFGQPQAIALRQGQPNCKDHEDRLDA